MAFCCFEVNCWHHQSYLQLRPAILVPAQFQRYLEILELVRSCVNCSPPLVVHSSIKRYNAARKYSHDRTAEARPHQALARVLS